MTSRSIHAVARQFASRLALIAFFTASVRGLMSGTDFAATIPTALCSTALFYALGGIVGRLAGQLMEEHVRTELQQLLAGEHQVDTAGRVTST